MFSLPRSLQTKASQEKWSNFITWHWLPAQLDACVCVRLCTHHIACASLISGTIHCLEQIALPRTWSSVPNLFWDAHPEGWDICDIIMPVPSKAQGTDNWEFGDTCSQMKCQFVNLKHPLPLLWGLKFLGRPACFQFAGFGRFLCHQHIHMSVCLSVYLSVYLSTYFSACISFYHTPKIDLVGLGLQIL